MKQKYNGHGGLIVLREDADRCEYKSEKSGMPKWYRNCTRDYSRKAMRKGMTRCLGWKLNYTTGRYETCQVYEVFTVKIRH